MPTEKTSLKAGVALVSEYFWGHEGVGALRARQQGERVGSLGETEVAQANAQAGFVVADQDVRQGDVAVQDRRGLGVRDGETVRHLLDDLRDQLHRHGPAVRIVEYFETAMRRRTPS